MRDLFEYGLLAVGVLGLHAGTACLIVWASKHARCVRWLDRP
jgi:hypothetical protein